MNEKESNRQRRFLLWSGLGAVAIVAAGGGAWILSLPPAPTLTAAPPIAKQEADAALTALKPPKRQRPLIAIIGINDATEVTDYLMPYGILRRSDVADVVALATKPGPLKLYPALKVEPQATVAEFEARDPEGASDRASVLPFLGGKRVRDEPSRASCSTSRRNLFRNYRLA